MQHVTPEGVPLKHDPNTLSSEEVKRLGQPKEPHHIIVITTPGGQAPAQDGPVDLYKPQARTRKRFNEVDHMQHVTAGGLPPRTKDLNALSPLEVKRLGQPRQFRA